MGEQELDPAACVEKRANPESTAPEGTLPENAEKDFWDKLGAAATLVTGIMSLAGVVLVAVIGAVVTFYSTESNREIQNQTAAIASHNIQESTALAEMDLEIKKAHNQESDKAETQNSLTGRAAAVEKFLPHVVAGDPGKAMAEIMIARLGYPELTLEIAKKEGDLDTLRTVHSDPRFLWSVSDLPQFATKSRSMEAEYRAAIRELDIRSKHDQNCLNGQWFDNNPGHKDGLKVEWSFNLDTSGQLAMIRTPGDRTGLALAVKENDQWIGRFEFYYYLPNDPSQHTKVFQPFQLFPEPPPTKGGCSEKIRTSNGFYFSDHKRIPQ